MATTVANLVDTLQTTGKFFHVLKEDGLLDDVPHVIINNKVARAQAVQFLNLLVGSSGTTPSYQRARDILRRDFIPPQEVADARGVEYTEAQLAYLQYTLPSKEVLQWARDNCFIVVAGPPSKMNLLDIRELNPQLFRSKSGGWYADKKEKFACRDTVGTTWLVLRGGPVPSSTAHTWYEQQDRLNRLSDIEHVPNVAEATWGFTTYFEVRGNHPLYSTYVRTSSVASSYSHVFVGCFDDNGLDVDEWSDVSRHNDLGLASARK